MPELSIGMATYKDFDGLYFTIQALRMYHDVKDVEFVVVDNYGCDDSKRFVQGVPGAKYVRSTENVGTAAAKNRVLMEATGTYVLCCDSHVLFMPGAIDALRAYYRKNPDTNNLIQGPLVYDDLRSISTHFDPVWRGQMWGTWATDPRGQDINGEPFDIPMQGMGAFSCRRAAWVGFNPRFRGFGGEEGYIQEKFRQRGARSLCLPALRWVHRFGRPNGVPYPLTVNDKFRNYVIGFSELGLDLAPVVEHFNEHLPEAQISAILREVIGTEQLVNPIPVDGFSPAGFTPVDFTPVAPAPSAAPRPMAAPRHQPQLPAGNLPLVSCICATYNRPPDYHHLIEETIECFLRQDYPNKELIIINDTPGQELRCDAPGVHIINSPTRYPSLGEKTNAAIDASHGELLMMWDDDDISLPWRISLSVERLGDADYFNPKTYWFLDGEGLHFDHPVGYAQNCSIFRRSAFERIGRFPPISVGIDRELDAALRTGPVAPQLNGQADIANWLYIYRWGVSRTHVSSRGNDAFYDEIGAMPIEPGVFHLTPQWRQDYVARTEAMIATRVDPGPLPVAPAVVPAPSQRPQRPERPHKRRRR